MDYQVVYDIIYALAAKDGREEALFGTCAPMAHEALTHSLASDDFPELWFEIPLAGEPWFDLHALTSHESLSPGMSFSPDTTGGYPEVFTWFANCQASVVRQLALSYDIGSGNARKPAIQLLRRTSDPNIFCSFLQATGRADAIPAYKAFEERIPNEWFLCYAGVFPDRLKESLRVECIPGRDLQKSYAENPALLEEHLASTGLRNLDDTIVPRCQELAKCPLQLEFQFDIDETGTAEPTFSASVRFASPPGTEECQPFDSCKATGALMQKVEEWGLADDRWRLMEQTMFASRARFQGESLLLYCYPAFVKLRWTDGKPRDAKAYLIAGAQNPEREASPET